VAALVRALAITVHLLAALLAGATLLRAGLSLALLVLSMLLAALVATLILTALILFGHDTLTNEIQRSAR
jgi:hypothetical protein